MTGTVSLMLRLLIRSVSLSALRSSRGALPGDLTFLSLMSMIGTPFSQFDLACERREKQRGASEKQDEIKTPPPRCPRRRGRAPRLSSGVRSRARPVAAEEEGLKVSLQGTRNEGRRRRSEERGARRHTASWEVEVCSETSAWKARSGRILK